MYENVSCSCCPGREEEGSAVFFSAWQTGSLFNGGYDGNIVFQNSAYAPNGVPLVPTQIISSVLNFLHFGLLILFAKKWKKGEGQVTGLYFALYSAGRFVLEFFRGDLERGNVGALSTSQFIAIFAFLFGAALFVWAGKRGAQGQAAVKQNSDGAESVSAEAAEHTGESEHGEI